MELCDKSFVLNMLSMPRLGLSPEQVQKIEAVIDGAPMPGRPAVMTYEDAAAALGLTAKNKAKTICLWVRKGYLDPVRTPGGKKSIGVTADSVAAFAASRRKAG